MIFFHGFFLKPWQVNLITIPFNYKSTYNCLLYDCCSIPAAWNTVKSYVWYIFLLHMFRDQCYKWWYFSHLTFIFFSEELPVCLKLNRQNRKTSAPGPESNSFNTLFIYNYFWHRTNFKNVWQNLPTIVVVLKLFYNWVTMLYSTVLYKLGYYFLDTQ